MTLTYAALLEAKRNRTLAALLSTPAARVDAAMTCAANDKMQRPASWWLDTLKAYVATEAERALVPDPATWEYISTVEFEQAARVAA